MKYILFSIKNFVLAILTALFLGGFHSCVDVQLEEVLDYDDFYNSLDDADVAILGLYGQFMELAGQVVVLNELRADLMDVTPNASIALQEINQHAPSPDNPWADVSSFYKVILSCNDILDNFQKMLDDKKMTYDEYTERYSDVAALRSWVYFQLGVHFGEVPYITKPIVAPKEFFSDIENYKKLQLGVLIDSLISCVETLPTLENYAASKLVRSALDGYSLVPFFINKKCLLGDLYLFANRYKEAATMYREVMATDEGGTNNTKYRLYTYVNFTGSNFEVFYARGREDDAEALDNKWQTMFLATTTDRHTPDEIIWFCAYDERFDTSYPFLKLFNPMGNQGGQYMLRPSNFAVDAVWGSQEQKNGVPFDARGLSGAFEKEGDNYYIRKYSLFPSTSNIAGNWFLYRAATLHLRYAEAANRAGYPDLAWVLVNDGFANNYAFKRPDGTQYPADSIKITGKSPFDPYPYPYSFDARWSDPPRPSIRAPWRSNGGVRGRANLPNIPFPDTCVTLQDSIHFMEKVIINESALELGFEGNRWVDLIRVARRMNIENPGSGDRFLWDENLAKKYQVNGNPVDISSEDKWFLPLYEH